MTTTMPLSVAVSQTVGQWSTSSSGFQLTTFTVNITQWGFEWTAGSCQCLLTLEMRGLSLREAVHLLQSEQNSCSVGMLGLQTKVAHAGMHRGTACS